MPETHDENALGFTAEDVLKDFGIGDTADDGAKKNEPAPTQETETEAPAGAEEEGTEGEGQDEGTDKDVPEDLETALEEIARLEKRLASKDTGYEKKLPAIRLGEALMDATDENNPKRAEAVAYLASQLGLAPAAKADAVSEPSAETFEPDWSKLGDDEYTKDHFETLLKPFVEHSIKAVRAELAAARQELADLKARTDEPLSRFEQSRQDAEFEAAVKEAAPTALRIYKLREKAEAGEDDLRAAMKKFPKAIESGEMKPVDALQAYMRGKAKTDAKGKVDASMPKTSPAERKTDPNASVEDIVDALFDKHGLAS